MRRVLALLFLLVSALPPAHAAKPAGSAELTPVVREHTIGLQIRGIAWPATLPEDLVSGLTNRLLIRIRLFSDSKQLDQKTAVIAIKYDLWEETFALTVTVNEAVILARSDETHPQIDSFLANIELPELFGASEVPKDRAAALRVEMLLNPIERERLEAIKKWVLENNPSIPAETSGFSDKRVGGSRANEVFNRIFEQYAQGSEAAAAWKMSLSSNLFRVPEEAR